MRARFVNEIKQNKIGSGLGPIGVGKTGMLNIPKRLKEMAKTWDWNDFYGGRTDLSMDAEYSVKNGVHMLEFDYKTGIILAYDKIDNPTITYDETTQTVEVFNGGVNFDRSVPKPEEHQKFDLSKEEDFNRVMDGLDNEWASDFYDMLIEYVNDYGNANEESIDDEEYRHYRPDIGGIYY